MMIDHIFQTRYARYLPAVEELDNDDGASTGFDLGEPFRARRPFIYSSDLDIVFLGMPDTYHSSLEAEIANQGYSTWGYRGQLGFGGDNTPEFFERPDDPEDEDRVLKALEPYAGPQEDWSFDTADSDTTGDTYKRSPQDYGSNEPEWI